MVVGAGAVSDVKHSTMPTPIPSPRLLSICKWTVTILQVLHVHQKTSPIGRAFHVEATCEDDEY